MGQTGLLPRVVHVVLGLSVGGVQRLVEQMLRTPPAGFAASCLCLDEAGSLGEALRREGADVHCLGRVPGVDLRLPRRIAAFARSRGCALLHCHQYTSWFYGVPARLFQPRLRVILTEHGRAFPDRSSRARQLFTACMAPLTHRVTAVSHATAEALARVEGFPRERIEVILNGVRGATPPPPGGRAEARAALGLPADAVCFVLACRFDPVKGLDGLVRAMRHVAGELPRARLLLLGDGEMRAGLEALIRELGLGRHVLLPGFRSDIGRWLAAADAFVLSSLDEGTSVSLLEAMAAGLPCVATRVGGNPFVVQEGETGLLVPPRDEAALAAGMLRLARDPRLRESMGRKARRRYEALFTWDGMLDVYGRMYRDLLAARRPSRGAPPGDWPGGRPGPAAG
ncbi:MAG TPA: glycosyltransferase [Thermoanaerobaculia bacterium]|nr:glycosyltransferase [Thermoanaerobaculia bacterium]